jgi:hypothetical protein
MVAETMSETDVTTLKNACETLNKIVQEFSTKMYEAAQQAGVDPNNMGGASTNGDDDIIDG